VAGHGPLEQLLLAEDLDDLALERGARAVGDALDPVGCGLAAADRAVQEEHPPPRQREGHEVHHDSDDEHCQHCCSQPSGMPPGVCLEVSS
jgi:hypothetical protein